MCVQYSVLCLLRETLSNKLFGWYMHVHSQASAMIMVTLFRLSMPASSMPLVHDESAITAL